jgi:hypothetical protein
LQFENSMAESSQAALANRKACNEPYVISGSESEKITEKAEKMVSEVKDEDQIKYVCGVAILSVDNVVVPEQSQKREKDKSASGLARLISRKRLSLSREGVLSLRLCKRRLRIAQISLRFHPFFSCLL